MQAFAEAAEALREAYRSGGDIRAATAPEREAEARVAGAAAELVRAQGKGATDAVVGSLGRRCARLPPTRGSLTSFAEGA